MIRKITLTSILFALAFAAQARTRTVGSGASTDAALSPLTVPGASVSGAVSSVSGNVISLAGGLVTIDASNAKITDQTGNTATIASITAGSTIFAVLSATTANANAALPAAMINVRRIAQVELSGPVTAVGANSLTVLGRTITVDSNTSFGGRARTIADILVNDNVQVAANAAGSALLASSIFATDPMPRATVISGTVKTIGSESWTITDRAGKEWTIVVNAQTKIVGDPKVGDTVEILANVDNANRYVALSIMKAPVIIVLPIVSFSGEVKSITATSWVVRDARADKDITLAIVPDTKISGDPKVADGVIVTARIDSNGAYTAISIIKLGIVPPPATVTIRGVVKSVVGLACITCDTIWTIGPPAGTTGPDTQVRSNTRTKIVGDPRVSDTVEVVAQKTDNGLLANSITKK
jgi:hypothetical protein